MPSKKFQNFRLPRFTPNLLLLSLIAVIVTCTATPKKPDATSTATQPSGQLLLAGFEQPNPPITWTPHTPALATAPDTQPTTNPAPILQRTSLHPHTGLWSQAITLSDTGGILTYTFPSPVDLTRFDRFSLQLMHTDTPANNESWSATISLTDASNATSRGDPYPIVSHWQTLPLDLARAAIDRAHITSINLDIRNLRPSAPALVIQTDTWLAQSTARNYIGSTTGRPRSFYVTGEGTTLRVGSVNQFEIAFADTCNIPRLAAPEAPMLISQSAGNSTRFPISAEGTGLFLFSQENLDILGNLRRTDPDDALPAAGGAAQARLAVDNQHIPNVPWLADAINNWHWEVVWTSPFAALIEGKEEAGPYDQLGEPRASLIWRYMIYQSGQVFVHVEWIKADAAAPDPVSWALMLEGTPSRPPAADDAQQRVLTEIYTAPLRQNLLTALPHRMQNDFPIAMLAYPPAGAPKNTWWWAQGLYFPPFHEPEPLSPNSSSAPPPPALALRKIFGAGFATTPNSRTGHAECLLVINNPNPLVKAATFSQYLNPPKIVLRQGELDKTVPGDADNDGFVESYGFQPIRLANGRAAFTVYPQQRPILAPTFLFTIPAIERPSIDFKHAHLIVNIDGKQFDDPPTFPDGSFLLQLPYTLDAPTTIEALLVK